MRFQIDGADAKTGEDRTITVEAASQERAVQQASERGVFTMRVTAMDGRHRRAHGSHPPDGQPTATRPRPTASAPRRKYRSLRLAAQLFVWIGLMHWGIAAVIVLGVLAMALGGGDPFAIAGGVVVLLPVLAGAFIGGLIFVATGEALHALRDIAVNTARTA